MTISNFVAYVKQAWKNKPDTSTPLSAPRLLHMEDGIKMTSDAIEKIAAAVVSQIVNDPDKIASMAALYAVNQKIGDVANLPNSAADVVTAITQQNSNLQTTNNNLQSVKDNMTHLSTMFRWEEVIVPIGELKENGGEVFNKTYIIPESYFENGKWTTAAITGFILGGIGYTNCSVTGCRVIGNKISYSVKNIGLTGLKNIELKVFIMFVLL